MAPSWLGSRPGTGRTRGLAARVSVNVPQPRWAWSGWRSTGARTVHRAWPAARRHTSGAAGRPELRLERLPPRPGPRGQRPWARRGENPALCGVRRPGLASATARQSGRLSGSPSSERCPSPMRTCSTNPKTGIPRHRCPSVGHGQNGCRPPRQQVGTAVGCPSWSGLNGAMWPTPRQAMQASTCIKGRVSDKGVQHLPTGAGMRVVGEQNRVRREGLVRRCRSPGRGAVGRRPR